MCQFPCNRVRSHRYVVDRDATGATLRIDAAKPQVVFAPSVHQPFEKNSQVFGSPGHAIMIVGRGYQ
jgi:hypothetical protein